MEDCIGGVADEPGPVGVDVRRFFLAFPGLSGGPEPPGDLKSPLDFILHRNVQPKPLKTNLAYELSK